MKTYLLLAFRNLFRNRRRTAMTLVVVAGGISALMLAGGFFGHMFWGLRESTIRNGVGHLQIYNADFLHKDETHALEFGLDDYASIASAVTGTPHVKGVAPRIEFFGMISNGMKSGTFMATAVDAATETRMGFTPRMVSGHGLTEHGSTQANEVVIGAGLARSMNAKPGTGLTLLAVTADGALNGLDVDVVGVLTTGVKELDDRVIRISLPAAQRLLQSERVTKLVVGLDQTENTAEVQAALTGALAGRHVAMKDWLELSPYYRQVKMLFEGIFIFMAVIVFFMVVMSSANTMMMSIFERTREIGTMLAMGTPRAWVIALFVLEGVATGALGALTGVAAGSVLGVILNHAGLYMPPPPGNVNGFPFRVQFEPTLMIGASVLVILTLAVASLPPAIRASRLRIVQALSAI